MRAGLVPFLGLVVSVATAHAISKCPVTLEESQINEYVARRQKLLADGSLQRQIDAGTYTADSLSIEMYEWWVQLGLASHGTAIDDFVEMITNAGSPQQQPPSKDWSKVVKSWAKIISSGLMFDPHVLELAGIIKVGMTVYQTAAMAASDPTQGGSTEFLKAAEIWRAQLPSQTTSHLLMVHDFINNLKSNNTQKRLPGAYDLVTRLIKETQSYRDVFNDYYAAYMKFLIPHPQFHIAAMAYQDQWPWSKPEVHVVAFWTPTPAGLDGCIVEKSVMRVNMGCIDSGTYALGNFSVQGLLINTKYDELNFHTWNAYEFSCTDVAPSRQTGCIDLYGYHHNMTEYNEFGGRVCEIAAPQLDTSTAAFEKLKAACASGIIATSNLTVAFNNVTADHEGEYYALSKYRSPSDLVKHECTQARADSIII